MTEQELQKYLIKQYSKEYEGCMAVELQNWPIESLVLYGD